MASQDTERPKRTVRLEIEVEAPSDLADLDRPWVSPDSALLSRVLEVATHRPVENRITMLDAFESVGVTVATVGQVFVGDETPDADFVSRQGARWYMAGIRRIAESILSETRDRIVESKGDLPYELQDLDSYLSDRAHEAVDSHEWVTYTHKARMVIAFSDSPDAYQDDSGDDAVATRDDLRAFYAMRADVNDAISRLRSEYLPPTTEDDDDDGCPDCGQDIRHFGGNPDCPTCAAEPADDEDEDK